MKPPTFFLSSTIFDFKDLRSALKYYLERQGCRVLASEFNDFPKPLDTHSYQACLRSIQEADWFVLLIGTRVGGWYDEASRISITQQEYREAYRLHQQGRLKLLSFVRSDVWQMKEDRKQLAKHLDSLDLPAETKKAIVNYPSKSAGDAEFIAGFIHEVGRNNETLAARTTDAALPTGNWIHVFDTFRDIMEAIQLQPFVTSSVEELAFRELLRRDLREIVRLSLYKVPNKRAFSPLASVRHFHATHHFPTWPRAGERTQVDTKSFDQLCSLSIHALGMHHHPVILHKALESSAFLAIDPATNRATHQPVYFGLMQLAGEVRALQKARSADPFNVVFENSPRARPCRGSTIDVDSTALLFLLHVLDRWCNVLEIAKAVIRHLDGGPFTPPILRPRSPIQDESIQLGLEGADEDDINRFLGC
jgi:hypothetical protein